MGWRICLDVQMFSARARDACFCCFHLAFCTELKAEQIHGNPELSCAAAVAQVAVFGFFQTAV